jgi:hypothetical protein
MIEATTWVPGNLVSPRSPELLLMRPRRGVREGFGLLLILVRVSTLDLVSAFVRLRGDAPELHRFLAYIAQTNVHLVLPFKNRKNRALTIQPGTVRSLG